MGHGSRVVLSGLCALLALLGGALAQEAYADQFTTLSNDTLAAYYDDTWLPEDGHSGLSWTGPDMDRHGSRQAVGTDPDAGAPHYLTDDPAYDDGFLPEKAHPDFLWDTCVEDAQGQPVLNGTRKCDLAVSGMDVHADLLSGGVDGVYKLVRCFDGKPLYIRQNSPPGERRAIYFSLVYGDWQFLLTQDPRDDGDILVYGNYGQLSPLDVEGWHMAADYNSIQSQYLTGEEGELYFKMKDVSVVCVEDVGKRTRSGPAGAHTSQAASPAAAGGATGSGRAGQAEPRKGSDDTGGGHDRQAGNGGGKQQDIQPKARVGWWKRKEKQKTHRR